MAEGWTLQIRPPPPQCMFAGHHYTSSVYLLDGQNHLVTGVSFGLVVKLLHDDESPASERILHLNARNLTIGKQGNTQFSYYFAETSLLHGNKNFKISVGGKGSHSFLPPAISTPIRVIRYQLQITNTLPTEWFKDQGGRDKHMSIHVQLQDFTRQPVAVPESIPLVVSLVYEKTDMRVNNQKILKMMSTANLTINSSGHAVVPFRIEEVSSNHQRQKFKIRVGPDTNKFPLHGDIAASFSSPVTVRSKKPKSKRVNRQDRNSNKRARLSPPGVIPQIGLSMQHALESSRSTRIPPIRPHQAIEDLITWATSAQDTFRQLEFQHIGYELHPNGQHDLSRKIFRCPACYSYGDARVTQQKHDPQCTLATILRAYEEKVGPGLAVVLRDIPSATDAYQRSRPAPSVAPQQRSSVAFDPTTIPDQLPRLDKNRSGSSQLGSLVLLPGDTAIEDLQPPPPDKPPPLGGYGWGNSLGWNSEGMNLSLPDNTASFAVSGVGFTPHDISQETTVHYSIAKPFANGATNLGFAGFDKSGQLKGFFQENQAHEGRGETEISFMTLETSKLPQADIDQLNDSLQNLLRSSLASKSLGVLKCLDDYQGDLEKMKEDISIFALKAEAGELR